MAGEDECDRTFQDGIAALAGAEREMQRNPSFSLELEEQGYNILESYLTGECNPSVPSDDSTWSGECAEGWSKCSYRNGSGTCCQNGVEHCEKGSSMAYCAPDKTQKQQCLADGKVWCQGSDDIFGDNDANACCPAGSTCGDILGHSYCKLPESECSNGMAPCRGSSGAILCCYNPSNESCVDVGNGFQMCTAGEQRCGTGETRCCGERNDKEICICCNNATHFCSGAKKGNPNCVPKESDPNANPPTTEASAEEFIDGLLQQWEIQ